MRRPCNTRRQLMRCVLHALHALLGSRQRRLHDCRPATVRRLAGGQLRAQFPVTENTGKRALDVLWADVAPDAWDHVAAHDLEEVGGEGLHGGDVHVLREGARDARSVAAESARLHVLQVDEPQAVTHRLRQRTSCGGALRL